jgi:oxygen-independent coproporphyrinogen III oxidase
MAERVTDRLVDAGYVRIGLDHYARGDDALAIAARDGGLRRNFQGYVADDSPWIVGVGASAISSLPRGFSQNVSDPAQYVATIAGGGLATARGTALTDDDRLRGAIIERLMCDSHVDLERECDRFHVDPEAFVASIDRLSALERDGLIVKDDRRLDVTEVGRPLIRFVCAAFDRHFNGAAGRHSRGI